jgi:hypothetical protein
VASVKVKSMSSESVIEKLTITAEDTQISIAWDQTVVRVPLKW